jgi:hypothetical protein
LADFLEGVLAMVESRVGVVCDEEEGGEGGGGGRVSGGDGGVGVVE